VHLGQGEHCLNDMRLPGGKILRSLQRVREAPERNAQTNAPHRILAAHRVGYQRPLDRGQCGVQLAKPLADSAQGAVPFR
jgi:hypothetical protein